MNKIKKQIRLDGPFWKYWVEFYHRKDGIIDPPKRFEVGAINEYFSEEEARKMIRLHFGECKITKIELTDLRKLSQKQAEAVVAQPN